MNARASAICCLGAGLLAMGLLQGARGLAAPAHQEGGKIMTEDENQVPPRSSSRVRAPVVSPVSYRGVRYEPLKDPASYGLERRQGYLMATEEASGRRLWIVKVYAVTIDPTREADVQEVYFRRLEIDAANGRLLVENERGGRFGVDLETGAVTALH